MTNFKRKNLNSRILTHENSSEHLKAVNAYFTRDKSMDIVSTLFRSHKSYHNTMVENYRKVLEREIDVLKLIGKRGLSYRGKHNEESSSFGVENLDRGNFLEILFLLSKCDAILNIYICVFSV